MRKTSAELLSFIFDRMVHVHGENPNCDYMRELRKAQDTIEQLESRRDITIAALAEAGTIVEAAREVVKADERRAHDLGVYILHLEHALAKLERGKEFLHERA